MPGITNECREFADNNQKLKASKWIQGLTQIVFTWHSDLVFPFALLGENYGQLSQASPL